MGVPLAGKCTPQHLRAQDIRALLGKGFFDYSFTIVRNPFARIESEYRMRRTMAEKSFWKGLPEFSPWLEENLARQTRETFHLDNHLRPQWEFVASDVEVFRLEDGMADIFAKVGEKTGLPVPDMPPHQLRSDGEALEWELPDRIRVREHYKRDFETFGYDADQPA